MTNYTRRPLYRQGTNIATSIFWRGSGTSPLIQTPPDAILTEAGDPVQTEDGLDLFIE